jgi:hypothetical protein
MLNGQDALSGFSAMTRVLSARDSLLTVGNAVEFAALLILSQSRIPCHLWTLEGIRGVFCSLIHFKLILLLVICVWLSCRISAGDSPFASLLV